MNSYRNISRLAFSFAAAITIILVLLMVLWLINKKTQVGLTKTYGTLGDVVAVKIQVWDDSFFGGRNALAYRVSAENLTNQTLRECVMVINREYSTNISDIFVGGSGLGGPKARGSNTLGPGEVLHFDLSHDVANRQHFRNIQKLAFDTHSPIIDVELRCAQGEAGFVFKGISGKLGN